MIKLIASDMDGSLLNNKKEIPSDFFQTIERLKQRNIVFAAASGRSYPKLEEDFRAVLQDIYFICDNGALVMKQGKILYQNCIDPQGLYEIIEACESIPNILLVLCGTQGAWHKPCPEQFHPHLRAYYIKNHVVEDLHSIQDSIFKIAICDLNGAANNCFPILNSQFGNRYSGAVSGPLWMDIMNQGVNKGAALRMIQQDCGASREETMAFGDYDNDIELLQNAAYSYVMANAKEEMRQYGRFIAPSNEENGVVRTIRRVIFQETE